MLAVAPCATPAALHCVRDSCRLRYFQPHSEGSNFTKASTPSLVVRAAQRVLESERTVALAPSTSQLSDSLDWPQPRRRNCTIRFLRPHLHAFTYMAPGDALLVSHWLRHYVDVRALGIPTRELSRSLNIANRAG